jgi:hypothetical protein
MMKIRKDEPRYTIPDTGMWTVQPAAIDRPFLVSVTSPKGDPRAACRPPSWSTLAIRSIGPCRRRWPAIRTFSQAVFHSLAGIYLACGGTPAGSARESRKTWDAIKAHYATVFG